MFKAQPYLTGPHSYSEDQHETDSFTKHQHFKLWHIHLIGQVYVLHLLVMLNTEQLQFCI